MTLIALIILAVITGAAGALAYGYRGQRDQEREQVTYLRKQVDALNGSSGSRALTVQQGGRNG